MASSTTSASPRTSELFASGTAVAGPATAPATAAELAELRRWAEWVRCERERVPRAGLRGAVAAARRRWRELPAGARRNVERYGTRVAESESIPLRQQFADLRRLGVEYGMRPVAYYRYQLYRPERRGLWARFVDLPQGEHLLLHLYRAGYGAWRHDIDDKRRFAAWCAERNYPGVVTLAEVGAAGAAVSPDALPAADLFTKPVSGQGGDGGRRWHCVGAGPEGPLYAEVGAAVDGVRGEPVTAAGLLAALAEQSAAAGGPILVQRVVRNHDALQSLTTGALATARLTTYRMPDGPPTVLAGTFRMPTGRSAVDNFHAGGLAAPVDPATGRLGAAITLAIADVGTAHAVHPDTGGAIVGTELPGWTAAVALVVDAHAALGPEAPVVGWDVALAPEGPVLVEANPTPCTVILQRTSGVPLGDTPYVRCLLAHLRRAFSDVRV